MKKRKKQFRKCYLTKAMPKSLSNALTMATAISKFKKSISVRRRRKKYLSYTARSKVKITP